MPARALSELQRLPARTITEGADTDRVGVAASANEITFWQGNVQISTRLLEGRYPDYKQLIPDHYPNRLHLGKENFLAALRRVQLLVRDNTTPVRLSMRGGGVDLTVQSQDVGDAAETVDGDYSGEELIIAFNPSYLIDGVEAVIGDEVIVETADASRAATVRGAEDDQVPVPPHAGACLLSVRAPTVSLRRLELIDFRIFTHALVEPETEGTTVITGANGTGKTSVLEAVAYLGTRRSFRGAPPEALVRTGREQRDLACGHRSSRQPGVGRGGDRTGCDEPDQGQPQGRLHAARTSGPPCRARCSRPKTSR